MKKLRLAPLAYAASLKIPLVVNTPPTCEFIERQLPVRASCHVPCRLCLFGHAALEAGLAVAILDTQSTCIRHIGMAAYGCGVVVQSVDEMSIVLLHHIMLVQRTESAECGLHYHTVI